MRHARSVGAASGGVDFSTFALVTGTISSAPLDLPAQMDKVYAALKDAGWTVFVKSIGTDFGWFPHPKDQPIELYLKKAADGSADPNEAEAALTAAVQQAGLNYSAVGRWGAELQQNVVVPTLDQALQDAQQTGSTWATLLKWGVPIAAVMVVAPYVVPLIVGGLAANRRRGRVEED